MGLLGRKGDIDPGSEHRDWQLVSKIAQDSLAEQRKSRRWGIFFKSLVFIYVLVILVGVSQQGVMSSQPVGQEHTAIVFLDGEIASSQPANADDLVRGLRDAFASSSSKAVILAINSPGGSPVQSGYVYDEIMRLREKYAEKKIYAVISELGASGGYYIASAANEIYADKSSLVGSIGVTAASFGFVGLMDKLGVERRSYTSGEHKGFLDPFSPQRQDEKAFWEEVLASTHQQFIRAVKEGRGDRLSDNEKLFTGLVWNGEQALEHGLVDGLGSAGYVAREIVQAEGMYDYTIRPTPFEEFAEKFAVSLGKGLGYFLSTAVNDPVKMKLN